MEWHVFDGGGAKRCLVMWWALFCLLLRHSFGRKTSLVGGRMRTTQLSRPISSTPLLQGSPLERVDQLFSTTPQRLVCLGERERESFDCFLAT